MSLYLLPPTGTVAFHKLEEYATKRLQFLLRLVACSSKLEVESVLEDANVVHQSDCLITNTAKDEVSHHILRLTLGGDPESMSFFCDSELALFKLRVENMVVDEWTVFFKSTEKFLRKLEGSLFGVRLGVLSDLRLVFEILKKKFESWYQLSTEMCVQTACMSMSFPFQLALRLVAGRLVNVVKGMAVVPVAHLKDVFIELFEKLMVTAAHQASMERDWAMTDERILKLAGRLKGLLKAETKASRYQPGHCPALRLADLWEHGAMFPPCMENVVRVLQNEHTLKHHDRIQLTLFLKELGLPVNDALLLWKREYSVPAKANKSRCCQKRWQGSEQRYIYNIRHLYGLEGSRTDYKAHSCSAIQNRALTCGDAGGCPFVSHDVAGLEASLLDENLHKDNIDHILKLCHHKMYGNACQSFMQHKLKQLGEIQSDFILDDRHIKIEGENSHNNHGTSDSNAKSCQESVQHNEVPRTKLKQVARLSSYRHGQLPYELVGGEGSFIKTEHNLNLQNEKNFLRLPLPSSNSQNIPNHCFSSSNLIQEVKLNAEGISFDDKRKLIYRRKRYLFKFTNKNQLEELVEKGIYSNTGSCKKHLTSQESFSRYLAHKTNKLFSQQEMDSNTEALQDKFVFGSDNNGEPLQARHGKFSLCSKQAEMTSLCKRKRDSFSSDVCEDSSFRVSNGISVSAVLRAVSGLSDPDECLSDPVKGKLLADDGRVKQLADDGEVKQLANPSKLLSEPVDCKQFSDFGELKQLAGTSEWSSDLSEEKCLSDSPECKCLSDHCKVRQLPDVSELLSDLVNDKQLSDHCEGKRLSDPAKWLSGHSEVKQLGPIEWLSDLGKGKGLSILEGKLSDPGKGKRLSILESKWLSDPAKCKWLSDHEQKQVSDFAGSKYLLDSPEGKWLSNFTEGTRLSNSSEGGRLCGTTKRKWLLDSIECKWLSDPNCVKQLLTPGKVEQLSCVNNQHPEYQRCTTEYNSLSTLGEAHPGSDPLLNGKPSGSAEMKTDTKFWSEQQSHRQLSHEQESHHCQLSHEQESHHCQLSHEQQNHHCQLSHGQQNHHCQLSHEQQNHHCQLSHGVNETTERQADCLLPSLAERIVSIKKPRDIYWFSRGLCLL